MKGDGVPAGSVPTLRKKQTEREYTAQTVRMSTDSRVCDRYTPAETPDGLLHHVTFFLVNRDRTANDNEYELKFHFQVSKSGLMESHKLSVNFQEISI